MLTEGRCFANIVGEEPIAVEAGEVIVFTRGDPHVLSSKPGMRADPVAASPLDALTGSQLPFFINHGGDGPTSAKLVCGFLACDAQPFNPLLGNLPPILKARDRQGGDMGWLGQFIRLATIESVNKRAGGESVLAKLSELMFIEVVRRYLDALPPEQAGWLAGLRDQFVGKALSQMHADPTRNRTTGRTGQGGGAVALGAGGAFHRPRRHAADAVSRQMEDADRGRVPEQRQRQYRDHCRRNRLRLGSGLQPGFQEMLGVSPRPGVTGWRHNGAAFGALLAMDSN